MSHRKISISEKSLAHSLPQRKIRGGKEGKGKVEGDTRRREEKRGTLVYGAATVNFRNKKGEMGLRPSLTNFPHPTKR